MKTLQRIRPIYLYVMTCTKDIIFVCHILPMCVNKEIKYSKPDYKPHKMQLRLVRSSNCVPLRHSFDLICNNLILFIMDTHHFAELGNFLMGY